MPDEMTFDDHFMQERTERMWKGQGHMTASPHRRPNARIRPVRRPVPRTKIRFFSLTVRRGPLTVITGSMFSGKTEELIRRIHRALYARQSVQVFKPQLDTRTPTTIIQSHNGLTFEAVAVTDSRELRHLVRPESDVIAIEEVQFFDSGIVGVCQTLADAGHQVVATGLDMDFRGCPFGSVPSLLAVADDVIKLRAICAVCGAEASRSQRLINGEPAPASAPTVLIGASEHYEARCRHCHTVRP